MVETYHNNVFGCFIWDLQGTLYRRASLTSWIRATEASWWCTTETLLGVSSETSWRHTDGTSLLQPFEMWLQRSSKTSWRRTTETYWWRSIETLLGVSFGTYLRRRWDVQRDVVMTSPQRISAGWVIPMNIYN